MEALLEFKGDPEKAYYNRRYYERGTHSHEYGKDAHKLGVNAVNTNHHSATPKIGANGNSIIKDRELGDTPSQRMNTYTQAAKRQADSGHKYADHARDLSKKIP